MWMNLPKWSGKCAPRASGAASAAGAARATTTGGEPVGLARHAGLFAAALVVTLAAGCSSGGGDGGGTSPAPVPPPPPGPPAGPVNFGPPTVLGMNVPAASGPAATIAGNGLATVFWGQTGLVAPGTATAITVPLIGVRDSAPGSAWSALQPVEIALGAYQVGDQLDDLTARQAAATSAFLGWRRTLAASARLLSVRREAGAWATEAIPNVGIGVSAAVFASNGSGTTAAAWVEAAAGGATVVRASRRPPAGTSWEPAFTVQTELNELGSQPAVAVDAAGNLLVVWRQQANANANARIQARFLPSGAGAWSAVSLVTDVLSNDARNPQAAPTQNPGEFMVAFEQRALNAMLYDVRARRSTGLTTWGPLATLEQDAVNDVAQVRLAANAAGVIFAAWWQNGQIWFNRNSGTQWATGAVAVSGAIGASRAPQLAVDAGGNAIVAWTQSVGVRDDAAYAYYAASGTTFSAPVLLEIDDGGVQGLSLAMAASGAAIVAWRQTVSGQAGPDIVARVARP